MSVLKKTLLIVALIAIGVINVSVYWNCHLYYRARELSDGEEKIEFLNKANRYFPPNDLVYYELGKAYYEIGVDSFGDNELSISYFNKSIASFNQSLKINPASQYCHFNLAKSLFYAQIFSPSLDQNPWDELKKATALVDKNSQIFFDVGKQFFARWEELSEEDKEYSVGILERLLEDRDRKKLEGLLHVWEMNVKKPDVIREILPEDPRFYRMFANFLGEKSLFLKERHQLLAEAEFLEFEEAKKDIRRGENAFYDYNLKEALQHFKLCLHRLGKLRFYQYLSQQSQIDMEEYILIEKSAYLYLAKSNIETTRNFKDAEEYLLEYLELEENGREINNLKTYLIERGMVEKKVINLADNLEKLFFHLHLAFKQNRFTEIIRIGRMIQTNLVVIPEDKKSDYIRTLLIVGDAFQKGGHIYGAGDFYQKAYELDPKNLFVFMRLLQNYKRLNVNQRISEASSEIEKLLYPKEKVFTNHVIHKGQSSLRTMVLDGSDIILNLQFTDNLGNFPALITVFFNGRVVWEDYLKEENLTLSLESKIGDNSFQVTAVNKDITFNRMSYRSLK